MIIKVRLYTQSAEFVHEGQVNPFSALPFVILWENRTFEFKRYERGMGLVHYHEVVSGTISILETWPTEDQLVP